MTESRWAFVFDVDPEQGVRTRRDLLVDFGDDNTIVAGGHFAGHVFGRVLPPAAVRVWASGQAQAPGSVSANETVRR